MDMCPETNKKKKKSLLTTKLKRSKSGAAQKAWEEDEDMVATGSLAETKKEGQERDKMATYEHL